ncbi:MAG: GNAT family N-acetyltransferase [Candidatus Bathyarchaeota archaeon]|jgi:GNAT superfamily N-acetyltransferase|nr:GNAT family N-acetyltransferase [Candidatus Bathyarchaeota archaeon]
MKNGTIDARLGVLVKAKYRGLGIGSILMKHAMKVAKENGARMLVLETQSCNVPTMNFYLHNRFRLIGFDLAAYSNEDVEKKEVGLDFGLVL